MIKSVNTVKILEIAMGELHPQTNHFLTYDAPAALVDIYGGKIFPANLHDRFPAEQEVITDDLEGIAYVCLKKGADYYRLVAE